MTCPRCGNPVPDGKLVCDCFARKAEDDTQELALKRFRDGDGALFLTKSKHLLPLRNVGLTICRNKRFGNVGTIEIHLTEFSSLERPSGKRDLFLCPQCCAAVRKFLDAKP